MSASGGDNSEPPRKRRKPDAALSSNKHTAKARNRNEKLLRENPNKKAVENAQQALRAKIRRDKAAWDKKHPEPDPVVQDEAHRNIVDAANNLFRSQNKHPEQLAAQYNIDLKSRSGTVKAATGDSDWLSCELPGLNSDLPWASVNGEYEFVPEEELSEDEQIALLQWDNAARRYLYFPKFEDKLTLVINDAAYAMAEKFPKPLMLGRELKLNLHSDSAPLHAKHFARMVTNAIVEHAGRKAPSLKHKNHDVLAKQRQSHQLYYAYIHWVKLLQKPLQTLYYKARQSSYHLHNGNLIPEIKLGILDFIRSEGIDDAWATPIFHYLCHSADIRLWMADDEKELLTNLIKLQPSDITAWKKLFPRVADKFKLRLRSYKLRSKHKFRRFSYFPKVPSYFQPTVTGMLREVISFGYNARKLLDGRNLHGERVLKWLHGDSLLVIVAGNQPTAAVLTGALCELAKHPHHAEKIYKEPEGFSVTDLSSLVRLDHLTGVLNEAMRLYLAVLTGGSRKTIENGIMIGETYIPPIRRL
ncbi:hypothetical protein DL766_010524 [Monosporascus sp. MC13-8B]|uniref:Uncharacterized protein n=1 Tax=Monosporascus cannonballus TaxID=155416 RepID=A0ABY0HLP2_9PEZI|nr:hypothetical protein DL762_001039 [Monosporascus cannonballus]RYP00108.1 hypothetical protein DL763_001037 [Monosporascus cannonballus]RYP02119.1 hypothetical protein DL766_010524 [Monosporascus sp. MC13-8B]